MKEDVATVDDRAVPLRVMAIEWNVPMLVRVLVELRDRHGWHTVYCVSEGTHELVRRHFPQAIWHDTVDARFGRPARELADMRLAVLDQPTAEALGYVQVLALRQMDRLELAGTFALRDRMKLFHRLFGYWSAVLDRLSPHVILMPTVPHVVYDYILYALAKRRGIPVIMFEVIGSEGLLVPNQTFEVGLASVISEYRRLRSQSAASAVTISERMDKYWRSLRGSYEQAMPYWVRNSRHMSAERKSNPLLAQFRFAWQRFCHNPLRLWRAPSYVTHAVRSALRPPAIAGHFRGEFYIAGEAPRALARKVARFSRRHRNQLIARYDSLAKPPDYRQPYVYVALHAQPELSTNPMGGIFDEQDIMIGLIASALPPGWKIYVKEHPAQFSDFASERGRWVSCYDTMLSYSAVTLVPRDTPAFELIDNAKAVACLVGSSCWEAVARGIPALMFGEAWYKGCEGVHTVRSDEDCKEAIARIAGGDRPDPDAVRTFLSVAEKYAVEAYLNDEDRVIARIDEATNIERLTSAIAKFYQNLKSSDHSSSTHYARPGPSGVNEGRTDWPQYRTQSKLFAGR